MLRELPEISAPRWLTKLSSISMTSEPFPLHELLNDSLYYPSSHFDGDPVRYLAGNILSFIYVDYGHTYDAFVKALVTGFRGYDLVASRSVTERELTPKGWHPTQPTKSDGDSARYRDWIKKPFCSWSVFQRREAYQDSHGPFRFSLLYLCADGVAAFQALYVANAAVPKAVAIIQPGAAFGNNWTNFTDPKGIFATTVLGNPSGQPKILLYGGFGDHFDYRTPCWPDYQVPVSRLLKHLALPGRIGVWTLGRQSYNSGRLTKAMVGMRKRISILREWYRPHKIQVLLVAESPPASSDEEVRFFYNPRQESHDYMYRSVMEAVFPDFIYREGEKESWLQRFRDAGYYMVDATDRPINHLSKAEKRDELNRSLEAALTQIKKLILPSTPIVLIKKNIFEIFNGPLRKAKFNVIHDSFLPFPSHGWQARFINECGACLRRIGR